MHSTKKFIIEETHCSVVKDKVILKGVRVSLDDQSKMAKKTCSNLVKCIDENGGTDRISKCLLHNFK
jgi:hypothetical protein